MILPGGTFDYSVIVERDADNENRWIGQAHTLRDSSTDPGMSGEEPLFVLEDGRISLHSRETRLSLVTDRHYRNWGEPLASRSFEVGDCPAAVMRQDDLVSFHRLGMGELALTIIRDESLVLGVGAIQRLPLGRGIHATTKHCVVDPQLMARQAGINYVKGPPGEPPTELHLRCLIEFAIGDESVKLFEGEEAYLGDYYVRVQRAYNDGLGSAASVTIARMSSGLTKDAVIESARLIANAS